MKKFLLFLLPFFLNAQELQIINEEKAEIIFRIIRKPRKVSVSFSELEKNEWFRLVRNKDTFNIKIPLSFYDLKAESIITHSYIPSGDYKIVYDENKINVLCPTKRIEVSHNNIFIKDGLLFCSDTVELYFTPVERERVNCVFYCSPEIAASVEEVAFIANGKVECFKVTEKGENYFRLEATPRKGRNLVEILVRDPKGYLRKADVKITPNPFYTQENLNFEISPNTNYIYVWIHLRDEIKKRLDKIYFIKKSETPIPPNEFENFFFEDEEPLNISIIDGEKRSYVRPFLAPLGEYIVEAVARPSEVYRKKIVVAPFGEGPEYVDQLPVPEKRCCSVIFNENDLVSSSLFEELKEKLIKKIYEKTYIVNIFGYGTQTYELPVFIGDKKYNIEFIIRENYDKDWSFSFVVDGIRKEVFSYSYKEMKAASTLKERRGNPWRSNYYKSEEFKASKTILQGPFILKAKYQILFDYYALPKGWDRRSGLLKVELYQQNQQLIDLSRYFK